MWRESLGTQAEAPCVVIGHDVMLNASSGFHSGLHMPGLPCSHLQPLLQVSGNIGDGITYLSHLFYVLWPCGRGVILLLSFPGCTLLFYETYGKNSTDQNSAPRCALFAEDSIVQSVPEHPKKEHVFCLSNSCGDVYLFQVLLLLCKWGEEVMARE